MVLKGCNETAGINVITCELNTVKEYAIAFHTHFPVNDITFEQLELMSATGYLQITKTRAYNEITK